MRRREEGREEGGWEGEEEHVEVEESFNGREKSGIGVCEDYLKKKLGLI